MYKKKIIVAALLRLLTLLFAFFVIISRESSVTLVTAKEEASSRVASAASNLWKRICLPRRNRGNETRKAQPREMGQGIGRIMTYDRAANERNAISALRMAGAPLQWHKLDDGVMGGRSETGHVVSNDGILLFKGMINTNGGGFASIRSPIPEAVRSSLLSSSSSQQIYGIKIRHQGDGKTYKFILTQPGAGGPMSRMPSWQADLPTIKNDGSGSALWNETIIPLDSLLPNWGGGAARSADPIQDKERYSLDVARVTQMGLMLSLKLSNGQPNPTETYGAGEFPFELKVQSIELVDKDGLVVGNDAST